MGVPFLEYRHMEIPRPSVSADFCRNHCAPVKSSFTEIMVLRHCCFMQRLQKSAIILIVVIIILVHIVGYFAFVKKLVSSANTLLSNQAVDNEIISKPVMLPLQKSIGPDKEIEFISSPPQEAIQNIRFSIKYPPGWKVEDKLRIKTCCLLNVFNSVNPRQGDFLKPGTMKAQWHYHIDKSISSKQQYIEEVLIKVGGRSDMGTPVSRSSVINVQNENGLDILKFNGGVGDVGYVIPKKKDFSEIIYIIVWNPDLTFEKVLSTFQFTN